MAEKFQTVVYLEQKQIDVLKKYNFYKEVKMNEIDLSDHIVVTELCSLGFLYMLVSTLSAGICCQGTHFYEQHFIYNKLI